VNALLPALLTASGVLAIAGIAKLRAPAATAAALAAAGVRVPSGAVRALGAGEAALAAACIVDPSTATAALVAAVYLGFAAFVAVRLRAAGDGAPCGCFGDAGAALTGWHLGLDLAAAAVAVAAALAPPRGVAAPAGALPAAAFAVGVLACVYLAHAAYTVLPALSAARGASPVEGSRWAAR
jgi:hypothetical protein